MNRRDLLKAVGASLSLSSALPVMARKIAGRITVQGIETFVVHVNARGNRVLVRMRTNEGLTYLAETQNLAALEPARTEAMRTRLEALNSGMKAPLW